MPFTRFTTRLGAALCMAAAIGSVSAQTAAPKGRGMAACRTDAATFCGSVEAGRGKRMACLKENQAKLSPECQAAVEARGAKGANGAASATGAASAEGPGGQPAGKKAAGAKNGGRMAACKTDRESLCAGVQKGGGAIIKCLKDNKEKLSPACGEALASAKAKRADAGGDVTAR